MRSHSEVLGIGCQYIFSWGVVEGRDIIQHIKIGLNFLKYKIGHIDYLMGLTMTYEQNKNILEVVLVAPGKEKEPDLSCAVSSSF